jgi:hypothetical protein
MALVKEIYVIVRNYPKEELFNSYILQEVLCMNWKHY